MKEKIIGLVKLFLLVFMMTMGFFLTYSLIWCAFGLDLTNLTMWIIFALACLSEFGYIKWIVAWKG